MSLARWLLGCALLGGAACDSAETEPKVSDPDPFCHNRPSISFCEDFDANKLPGLFETRHEEGSGKLTLRAEEQPYTAYELEARTTGGSGRAQLTKSFDQEGYKFRIFGFIWLGESDGASGETELFGVDIDHEDGSVHRLGVRARADGSAYAYSDLGTRVDTFETSRPLMAEDWGTFRFDFIAHDATRAELHVRFGADSVVWEENVEHLGEYAYGTMKIGLVATGEAAWTARYDDLTFEID